jgi:hypothetical protein
VVQGFRGWAMQQGWSSRCGAWRSPMPSSGLDFRRLAYGGGARDKALGVWRCMGGGGGGCRAVGVLGEADCLALDGRA